MLFYLVRMVSGKELWGRLATVTALIGLVAQTVALVLRWVTSYQMGIGHVPLSNLYESMIFFALGDRRASLPFDGMAKQKNRSLGTFVVPWRFLSMPLPPSPPMSAAGSQPLIPTLQSNWLTTHVLTCFLGYAAFTVAFALGLMVFMKGLERKVRKVPGALYN